MYEKTDVKRLFDSKYIYSYDDLQEKGEYINGFTEANSFNCISHQFWNTSNLKAGMTSDINLNYLNLEVFSSFHYYLDLDDRYVKI